jgi:hypothetical protein
MTQVTLMMMTTTPEEDHHEDRRKDHPEDPLETLLEEMTHGSLEDQEDLTVIQEEDPRMEAHLEDHLEALEAPALNNPNLTDLNQALKDKLTDLSSKRKLRFLTYHNGMGMEIPSLTG